MDKRKLVAVIAKKTDYAQWEINKIFSPFVESILEALRQGEVVNINGFGKFELKFRKARIALHPRTREPIQVPEKVSVVFTITEKFEVEGEVLVRLNSQA